MNLDKLKQIIKEEIQNVLNEERFKKGTDIGKKGKGFAKIAKSAGKEYGSEEAGKRVAGAILKKVLKEKTELAPEKEKTKTKEKEEAPSTPKRRTLAPPKESPNTKPKALMKENEKELVNKIAQRFKKLSK